MANLTIKEKIAALKEAGWQRCGTTHGQLKVARWRSPTGDFYRGPVAAYRALELFPSYAALRDYLSDLPVTWYPDLIRAMVLAAHAKGVFKPGGAARFVRAVEASASEVPPN